MECLARDPFRREGEHQGVDLSRADLFGVNLNAADLSDADLTRADLRHTCFTLADLRHADLTSSDLSSADLTSSILIGTNLMGASLTGADFTGAYFGRTILGFTDLKTCKGLESCRHASPSSIDFDTLQRSGPLPLSFLRGVGLSDRLIEYLPSLTDQPVQLYSCFISYSTKDDDFVNRLYADLQNKGVRCWFAPHDMLIGAKIHDAIDEGIRLRDKVLLVLSEASIASDWVEGEVTRSLDEEQERKQIVLLPIRIDNAAMETSKGWARMLRGQRHIGDFTRWKEHDAYSLALERLLAALRTEKA